MLPAKTILQHRYEIVRSIGQGGVGAVYEAQDIRLRNPVALKHLTLQGIQASKAFEQEAQLLSKLRHSALPRVIDHFTDAQGQFLVMDYIDGDDLGVQLQRGKAFSVNDVLRWSDKLLQALEYLHHQTPTILHRDIKPSNIKVTTNDDVMLLDFGLAKGTIATQQLLTSSSIRGYTPLYAPLEQIQGSGTDERSDLFALAATMYHLMTGKPAADALSRAADVLQQQSDPLIEPRVLNQQIPHHVSQVLMQALSLNRSLRPASANAMRQALHNANLQPIHAAVGTTTILAPTAFVSNPQVSGATIVLNRAQNPRNIAKWGILAAIVAFVLGCGTLAVFSATSRTSEPTSEGIAVQINPTDTFPLATIKPIQTVPVVVTQAVATIPLAPTIPPTQQPTDSPQPTSQPTATTIPATATPAPDAVVAIAQLNMREGPDTTYNLVSSYNQGTPLELLGKNSDASWLKVRAPDGNIGWMFAANLDLGLALGGIEVAAAPPRPTSVPQPTLFPTPSRIRSETINVPFNGGIYAVDTSNSYEGLISINISGVGQASGSQYSDAFYLFTDKDGNLVTPLYLGWVFTINGEVARKFIPSQEVPAYRSDHNYVFFIDVPGGVLTLGVADTSTNDNTGSYNVTFRDE